MTSRQLLPRLLFSATEVVVEMVGVSGGDGRGDNRDGRDDNRGNGAGEVGMVEVTVEMLVVTAEDRW